MEKQKGFTLTELLAVIVILAIILLISVPIVLNVIEDARTGAFKNSAGYLMKAAENKYLTNQLNGTEEDLVYIYENGKIKGEKDLDYKGETPKNGTIVVRKDGKIGIAIDNGKWCAIKSYDEDIVNLIKLEENNCKLNDVPEIPEEPIVNPFDEEKGVNKPVLTEGMTPIKWDGTTEVATTQEDPEWYDYTNKKWANAKTADESYWVWIPRYAYQIASGYHTKTAGTINIKFLKGKTNTASDGSEVAIIPTYSGSSQTNYIKHSAFTFGEEEILGFWVAKYEPSVANQSDPCYTSASEANCNKITLVPKIVPNAISWRYTYIGNQFDISYNMRNNSTYGWNSDNVDTHMMKNSEWGAVAYLSKSTFGANNEIWINNSSHYRTGCSGNSVSAVGSSGCQNAYNTTNGQKSSTTHNITGIYDISGGAYEYVAAYINNGNSNLTKYGQSMINAVGKYKDLYIKANNDSIGDNYITNRNIYGDAVYETSLSSTGYDSWYGDYAGMPYSSAPWFLRGGYYYNHTLAGAFYFDSSIGSSSADISFRPVVIAQ